MAAQVPGSRRIDASGVVRWFALLCICSAYLQGGLVKVLDFAGAVAEMKHFDLVPGAAWAVATIALELGAALLVLTGRYRWLGALALAAFTLAATFMANRYWDARPANRMPLMNAFYEHIGLVGAFVLVAWHDLQSTALTRLLLSAPDNPAATQRPTIRSYSGSP